MEDSHGHPAGQGNIQIFGLDINAPVFAASGIITLAFIVGALDFPGQSDGSAGDSSRMDYHPV